MVVMGVCLRRYCLNMSVVGDICLFGVGPEYDGLLWGVLSVIEVCADYGGVNVFHVCLNLSMSVV